MRTGTADICLICEGTYPYVRGGVSSWIHDLIQTQETSTFHIVSLLADRTPHLPAFRMPENVVGVSHIYLQDLFKGARRHARLRSTLAELEPALVAIQRGTASLSDLSRILTLLTPFQSGYGRRAFLNSEAAFDLLTSMYNTLVPSGSFLNYFWSWRSLMGGLFASLLSPLPPAKLYHTICTGYAGLFAARARLQTGRPALVTEHGIYTNERRIELTLADWLYEGGPKGILPQEGGCDLADIWYSTFKSFASICYSACERVVTLCSSNQVLQKHEGADPRRTTVIPNGIDVERFARLCPSRLSECSRPTIALIGRVVPIKDIKTYIHACFHLRDVVPGLLALVLGGTDEDPGYFEECVALVKRLGLERTVEFHGQVRIDEYLPNIDLVVFTSLSEVQPLTILEAGAAGIPVVATDVGACREMVLGSTDECPSLGDGGQITPIGSPAATANAIIRLLKDPQLRWDNGKALQNRVRTYYNRPRMAGAYRDLYRRLCGLGELSSVC